MRPRSAGHKEMLGYGIGGLGIFTASSLIGTFLSFYYTDIVGISAGIVGTLMLLVRVMDGAADIGMGILVDRTKSKYGKARPWILWMALPIGFSTISLFLVPDIGMAGKIAFVYVTFIIFNLIFTAVSIPFKTLLGMITQDNYERGLANIYSGFFTMIGSLLVMTLTQPLANKFGWTPVAITIGAMVPIALYITYRSTRERVGAAQQDGWDGDVPIKIGVKALFANKYWLIITLCCVISYAIIALGQSAGLYYATYIFGNTNYFSFIGLALTAPMVIGLLLIASLVKKIGKRNVALIGTVFIIIGQIIKIFGPESLAIFLIGSAFAGLGAMPIIGLIHSMINDTIEYGELKSGVRTAGLVNSGASFGMKVGTGLGMALIGWLLSLGSYAGGAAEQTHSAEQMIVALNIYIPMLLAIVQFIFLRMYHLDREYPVILDELKQRNIRD
ncbi:MFS transporter [Peribacillus glennii]|uniref:MFS transporter n=2 Tax=Peribacillus glennii TaxID=2303991 RepID=A0A372LJ84_9BACI|nr:MFS transporter [Peribacillus glennii]